MKKDTIRAMVVAIVALVIYQVIAFVIPFEHTAAFWVSYIFTLVAFAIVGASIYIAFLRNPSAKSRFYGFPIARIGVIYGVAQFAVSLVVMVLAGIIGWKIPLVIYVVGLGVTLVGLVGAEAVVDEIQTMDVKQKKDTNMMHNLQSKVSHLAAQSDNAAVKALAEEFRYSDPVSSEFVADAETDLAAAVEELQAAYVDGDNDALTQLCRKTTALLAERNRICKLNKN